MDRIRQSSMDRYREKKRDNKKFYLPELKQKSIYYNRNDNLTHQPSFYNKKNKNLNFTGFSKRKKLIIDLKKIKTQSYRITGIDSNKIKQKKFDFSSSAVIPKLKISKNMKKKLFCLSKHFRNKKIL